MKYIAFVVVIFVSLNAAAAKATPKPKSSPVEVGLEDLKTTTNALFKNVTEALGFKDVNAKKIEETIHNQAKTFASNVDQVVEKLKTEFKSHEPEMDKTLKEIQTNLAKTAADIQKALGPNAEAKGKELKENFEKGLQTVLVETKKMYNSMLPQAKKIGDDLKASAKDAMEMLKGMMQGLQTQMKTTIEEHQKTHKH